MKENVFFKNMLRYGYIFLLAMGLYSLLNLAIVRGNEVISLVIDRMLSGQEVKFEGFLLEFLGLTLAGFLIAFLANAAASEYAVLVLTKYRKQVAGKLYHLEYKYFDENYSSSVINRVNSDLGEAGNFLQENLIAIMTDTIALIIYANYVRRLNMGLFLVMVFCYPIVFWIASVLRKKMTELSQTFRVKTDAIIEIDQDAISGEQIVKSFGLQDYFREKMHHATAALVENEEKRTKISNAALIVRKMIQWIPNIVCALYSVVLVKGGALSVGELLAFVIILEKLVKAFTGLPFGFVEAAGSLVCIGRLEEIFTSESESFGTDVPSLDNDVVLAFEDVSFGYYADKTVLDHLSFRVRRGENVAFVGESGGGKSTVFHILCGFYKAWEGQYRLYGTDIVKWDIERARDCFAYVSQNIFLFPVSIEENILYGNEAASHEQVVAACEQAEIHEFIMTLPMQYETIVGERGSLLSGGQKQRISIARAILKNAPILLLDEPTSAIDEETEELIQRALNRLSSGRTCVTIAHRLSTVKSADRIMVLKDGRIAEEGTHDSLIERNGIYAAMYGGI